MSTATGGRGKNKVVAGVLGILLGGVGAHHYYLGSTMAGVVTLVLCCVGVGGILGLVEGIMLLMMSDADFDAKYNARTPESMEFVFMKK
jgi:TM2 domain-containing membrane protein YozV